MLRSPRATRTSRASSSTTTKTATWSHWKSSMLPSGSATRAGSNSRRWDEPPSKMNELWAADPLSDRSIAAIEAIEKAITVDLIATFEPQLKCCAASDTIVSLLADSNYAPYDYLPVRSDDRIVGLLRLDKFRGAPIDPGLTTDGAM